MRQVHAIFGALGLMLMLSGLGCKHGQRTSSPADVPPDLMIIFGQQGTFAGRATGYSINAEGEVTRWEGKFPGETKQAEGRIDLQSVRKLWQRAEEIGFLSMQDQAMASVYHFISLSAGDESRRVTWAERDESSPSKAQMFYDECMETARAALGEN